MSPKANQVKLATEETAVSPDLEGREPGRDVTGV